VSRDYQQDWYGRGVLLPLGDFAQASSRGHSPSGGRFAQSADEASPVSFQELQWSAHQPTAGMPNEQCGKSMKVRLEGRIANPHNRVHPRGLPGDNIARVFTAKA
jgi:hypothetical protein